MIRNYYDYYNTLKIQSHRPGTLFHEKRRKQAKGNFCGSKIMHFCSYSKNKRGAEGVGGAKLNFLGFFRLP